MASLGRFVWMTIPQKILLYGFGRMFYTWAPMLCDSWGISRDQMTIILTAGELASIGGGFIAPLADKFGNRAIALIAWIFATLCAGLVLIEPTLTSIMMIRLVFCFVAIVYTICAQSTIVTGLDENEKNGMATGLSETSWSLSSLVLIPLLSLLYDYYGWRSAFAAFAGLMVVFSLEVIFFFPKDTRLCHGSSNDDSVDKPTSETPSLNSFDRILKSNYMTILTKLPAMLFNLSTLLFNISHNLVFICFTYWAVDRFDVEVEQMALVGFVLGAAELIGSIGVMFLADRLGMYRCIYASLCIFLVLLIGFVLAAWYSTFYVGLALFSLLYIPAEVVIVVEIAAVESYVPSNLRSTMLGINFQCHYVGRAIGAAVSTLIWTRGGLLWMTATGCFCTVLAFVCVFFAHRSLRESTELPRESRCSSIEIMDSANLKSFVDSQPEQIVDI